MKKLLLSMVFVATLTVARADFTSYTLVSQSDPLTYLPTTSYTFDSLTINMDGNSGGNTNYTQDFGSGAEIVLSFTNTESIVGDSVQLAWIYPEASSVYEYFPSIIVPGTVFLGYGASDFTITGNTVTIDNDTEGWTGADFNGFTITDLTEQSTGPSNVPDTASTLLLIGAAMVGLAIFRRGAALVRG
jgi:hypothetical protein